MEPEVDNGDYGVTYSQFIGMWYLAWKQNKTRHDLAQHLGMTFNAVRTRAAMYERDYGFKLPELNQSRPPRKSNCPKKYLKQTT